MATSSSETSELKSLMEKLMTKLVCFYDEQSLTDVTFKVSNPPSLVPAHRLILSAASPYFENLFKGEAGNQAVIEINDIDSDTFQRLISFCYSGEALNTVDNVAAMLKAAIVLQLEEAANAGVDYLMGHISECTLQGAYALERETQFELLKQKIHEYELENFMEISQSDEFLSFDVEKLQSLLESDHLNIAREEDAFDAITRWFNHDVSARQEHLPQLIACLRLTQFDVDFLLAQIKPLPGCELLALKASMWIKEPTARTNINIRFPEPRGGCTLLAIYDTNIAGPTCVLQYNKAEDKWQQYGNIYNYGVNRSAILKDGNIVVFGDNDDDGKACNNVYSWNLRNKTWRELPAMNHARESHCVVELDGSFYAIGGNSHGNNILQSVERYTTTKGWEFVKPLITARYEAGAVALNGKIYVVGGKNKSYLKSVECYNPDSDTWTNCADMAGYHWYPAVAAHKGHIYVAGDFKGYKTVERYDPERDTWSKICSLKARADLWTRITLASLGNTLWTIGGKVGNNSETNVACYDEENDHWVQKRLLPPGSIHSCFVVPVTLLTAKNK